MDSLEEIKKRHKIGTKIIEQLFSLSDKELKEKITSIIDDEKKSEILRYKCNCIRTIENEIPKKIEFWYYDGIIIDWSGISIKPEHGSEYSIVKFNKYFQL